MRRKSSWKLPIAISSAVNLTMLVAGSLFFLWNHVDKPVEKDLVKVSISSNTGTSTGGQGGAAPNVPAITAPKESQAVIPDPIPDAKVAEQVLQEVKSTLPTPTTPVSEPVREAVSQSAPSSQIGAATDAVGIGTGGTGEGSGEGTGSGEGAGSGDGIGAGDGGGLDPDRIVERGSMVPISQTAPEYPPSLRRKGITGVVGVHIIVEKDGSVSSASVSASSGYPEFDRNAVDAVYGWWFTPATEGGVPVRASAGIDIRFSL